MLEDMGCAKLKKWKDQQAQAVQTSVNWQWWNGNIPCGQLFSYKTISKRERGGGTGLWLQRLRQSEQRKKEGRKGKRRYVKSCGWEIKGSRRRKKVAKQQTKWICRLQEQKTKGKRNSCQSVKVRVRERDKILQLTTQTTTVCLIIQQPSVVMLLNITCGLVCS